MPRAMVQAGMIQKKSSRVKIVLEEKVPGLKMKKPEPAIKEVKPEPSEKAQEKFKKPVVEAKKPVLKKEVFGGVRKFFRRKSI